MTRFGLKSGAIVCLGPAIWLGLISWQSQDRSDSDFLFALWIWLGIPSLAMAVLLFWLDRKSKE